MTKFGHPWDEKVVHKKNLAVENIVIHCFKQMWDLKK